MKIAILSLRSRYGGVTGDCVQAEKTTEALKNLGQDADRYYLDPKVGDVYDSDNILIGTWQTVFATYDIVHAIPPIAFKNISRLPKVRAKLVCSSVFWRSWICARVVHKNSGRLSVAILKDYFQTILAKLRIRAIFAYDGYDLILPNSEDEVRVLRKYARIKKDATIMAVPNAIDVIPCRVVNDIPRSSLVPSEDYILIPGFFAPRKNQLQLIRALSETSYKVVFMGKGPCLEKCKALANPNMRFIGHIAHGSDEFYSIMKYARVVCLPSNCETPGIAGLEAAALGARPVVPYEGGTTQYYGWDAEYHNPLDTASLKTAVDTAWKRGRLTEFEQSKYASLTWEVCAKLTLSAYRQVMDK